MVAEFVAFHIVSNYADDGTLSFEHHIFIEIHQLKNLDFIKSMLSLAYC